jgi:hypothetical protein
MDNHCSICLVDIDNKDSIKLSCGHCYHKSCINKAVYIFEDETTIEHEIKPCPYCRNILTPIDKKNTISGEQFTRVMQYILENIEDKPNYVSYLYDAYQHLIDVDYNDIDTGITADEVYERIYGFRDYEYEKLRDDNHDINKQIDIIDGIRLYTDLIGICSKYFGFCIKGFSQ